VQAILVMSVKWGIVLASSLDPKDRYHHEKNPSGKTLVALT